MAEAQFSAGYNGGFFIRSEDGPGIDMRIGGTLDADYRYYAEEQRADNRFDIRKARLKLRGQISKWFRYGMEYEFQGAETTNLLDAFGEFVFRDVHAIRMGQFKEPFSLEWQTPDRGIWFAERSMGNALTPLRDVGAMAHGSFLNEGVIYGFGAFNGDGIDGSSRGSEEDSPELTARMVFKPFTFIDNKILSPAQFGLSASRSRIDTVNVDLNVKTTGMVGLSTRNVYVLNYATKFGVLEDVDSRTRLGMDGAWVYGPFALTGEYMHLTYSGLTTSSHPSSDADFSDWYVSMALCLTGEDFSLAGGVVNPVIPAKSFNPDEGTFGAFVLALRSDHFKGDEDWITPDAYVSTHDVDSTSIALNWILFPMLRILVDYTHSDFSSDIKVRVNPDGSIDYIHGENVLTLRMSFDI
jgi:phosphate-selective porin OprO/OprP